MYEQYENEILDKLKADVADVAIEQTPERPEDYNLNHPTGAILVGYAKTSFAKPDTVPFTSQAGTMEIDLTLMFRSMRGAQGIYEYLEQTRTALLGFKMSNEKKLYLTRENFIDYNDGVWVWNQTFAFSHRVSQS